MVSGDILLTKWGNLVQNVFVQKNRISALNCKAVKCYLWSVICKSRISYACEATYLKMSHLQETNKV